jgi:hypothetical protein
LRILHCGVTILATERERKEEEEEEKEASAGCHK